MNNIRRFLSDKINNAIDVAQDIINNGTNVIEGNYFENFEGRLEAEILKAEMETMEKEAKIHIPITKHVTVLKNRVKNWKKKEEDFFTEDDFNVD